MPPPPSARPNMLGPAPSYRFAPDRGALHLVGLPHLDPDRSPGAGGPTLPGNSVSTGADSSRILSRAEAMASGRSPRPMGIEETNCQRGRKGIMAREISQSEYESEVVGSPVPVLLDVYGEHCGP